MPKRERVVAKSRVGRKKMKWLIQYNRHLRFAAMFAAPVIVGVVFLNLTKPPEFSHIHSRAEDVQKFNEMLKGVQNKDPRRKIEDAVSAVCGRRGIDTSADLCL